MNFQQWLNETNGRGIDVDGSYGNQCWDLWSLYAQQVLGVPQAATNTGAGGRGTHNAGYACEIWHQFGASPLPAWFTTVGPGATASAGDVAIWEAGTAVGPSSHIAIVVADQGGAINTLTQNPGNSGYRSFTKAGLLGYLRPINRDPFSGGAAPAAQTSSLGDHIAAEGADWTYWVPSTQDQATVQTGLNIAGYNTPIDGNLTSDAAVRAIQLLTGKFGFFDLNYYDGKMNKNLCHAILLMAKNHGGYTGRMDWQIDGHVWAAFDGAVRATAPAPVPAPTSPPVTAPVVAPEPIVTPVTVPEVIPEVIVKPKPVIIPKKEYKMTEKESAKQAADIAALPPSDLGAIITSPRHRVVAYAIFALLAMTIGNTAVGFASLQLPFPSWLVVATALVNNLAVPFAALAVANAKTAKVTS